MKKIVLLGLTTAALVLGGLSAAKVMNAKREALDAQIVVQLKGNVNRSRDAIIREQNAVISEISDITTNFKVKDRFTTLVNAFSIDVPQSRVSAIENLPDVKHVDFDSRHAISYNEVGLRKEIQKAINVDASKDNYSKSTMNVPDETNEGEGVLIAILDTGYLINGQTFDDDGNVSASNVTHKAYTALADGVILHDTEVSIASKVAADGFHGKPDANHSVYFNNKVPFFYDYGGQSNVRGEPGPEDYDVFAKGQDHGNHVASTAAGNDPYYKGIAPKAQLVLMKVFTDYTPTPKDAADGATASTGAYDSSILKALEDCDKLGVDIISMSLGSSLDDFDSDSTVQKAIKELQRKGVFINVAAGNDGKATFSNSPYEYWTTDMGETGILSSYSNNEGAMSIAAAQADKQYYDTALIIGTTTVSFKDQVENYTSTDGEVKYNPERKLTDLLADHPDGNFEWIRIGGWGEEKDYEGKDAAGKIAIVDRGETTFVSKIQAAEKAGAIAIGIINNDPTDTSFSFRMDLSGNNPLIPVISILFRDKETFDNASTTTAKLLSNTEAINPTAGQVTDFTSDGPTYDLRLKPEISAPGQSILGAVLDSDDAYDYYDGTSMATPNYSGAMAVILSKDLADQDYRSSINARIMSTANPLKDKFLVNYESVRKQGAGMIDVAGALNSKVYLDGATGDTLSGKAKIELGNNDKIKEGKVALSFSAISAESSTVNYTAKTYVYRPELVELNPDNENYKEFIGKKFQATYDKLVATATQNVTVNAGKNVINLDELSVPANEINDINANFPDGCYLEGYVVLEAEGKETLVIPFLGFYGDYSSLLPIEPFKFERDNSKTYPSDLVNYLARNWSDSKEADFASDWVSGYYSDFNKVSTEKYLLNEKKLTDLTGSNSKKLVQVGNNPYTGEVSPDDIYMGNNGYNNTMIIAQYVMRSVKTNTITLKNKATGEVVLTDHMYDALYGAEEDDLENEIAWPLYKSHIDTSLWGSKLYAHRAYTIIPLYDNIYNKKTEKYSVGDLYPDGEYEMLFSYEMAGGGHYEKKYTLHIDSLAPQLASRKMFDKDGEQYLRLRFNEAKLSYLTVNGYSKLAESDEEGYYLDLKASDYQEKNKLFIKAFDYAGSVSSSLTYLNDPYQFVLTNDGIIGSMDYQVDAKQNGGNIDFAISVIKDGAAANLKGNIKVGFVLPEGFSADDLVLKVGGVESKDFILKDGYITFNTTSDKLSFSISSASYVDPNPAPSKSGCGADITMISGSLLVMLSLSAIAFALLYLKKRKEML